MISGNLGARQISGAPSLTWKLQLGGGQPLRPSTSAPASRTVHGHTPTSQGGVSFLPSHILFSSTWHARCLGKVQKGSSTNRHERILEGVMDTMDQIYLWKRLYWEAIGNGCEPCEAERIANRSLPCSQRTSRYAAPTIRISSTYAAVAV